MGGGKVMRDGADVKLGGAAFSATTRCLSATNNHWLYGSNANLLKAISGFAAAGSVLISTI